MKQKLNPTDKQKRNRTGALLLSLFDDMVGDLVAVASIREQARIFGVDRVRGL